jgi:hypothetical protein
MNYEKHSQKLFLQLVYRVFNIGVLFCLLAACNFFPPPATPEKTLLPSLTPSERPTATPYQPSPLPSATDNPTDIPLPSATLTPTTEDTPIPQVVRFAVIGDYGSGGQPEADVANLVKSWNPQLILTTGDNNYPDGSAETIDQKIGQFYHEFISPYSGGYGAGAGKNRFFPSLGNHDWNTFQAQPYLGTSATTVSLGVQCISLLWTATQENQMVWAEAPLKQPGCRSSWLPLKILGRSSIFTMHHILLGCMGLLIGCSGRLLPGVQTLFFQVMTIPTSVSPGMGSRILSMA